MRGVFRKFNDPRLIFVLSFITLFFLLGLHKVLFLRPQSIHQWAQCDRASVAWNYYTGDYDFFHPRVNNIANGSGITGMEFPVIQYIVALLYGAFGFHEWIYRCFTLLVTFFGLFSTWRVAEHFTGSRLAPSLIVLLFACSPLVAYYSVSFIPDIYSMWLVMIALHMLVRERHATSKRFAFLHWVFVVLACLIKPTFVIYLPAMLIARIGIFGSTGWKRPLLHFLAGSAVVLVATVTWYSYAKWLSKAEHSGVFLLNARPVDNWDQLKEIASLVRRDWINRLLNPWIVFVAGALLPFSFLAKLKQWPVISWMALSTMPGIALWVWLMGQQLPYHDYYALLLIPACVFVLMGIVDFLTRSNSKRMKTVFCLVTFVGLVFQFYDAKTHVRISYKKGSWKYGHQFFDDYFDADGMLTRSGINEQEAILSAFDPTPNVSLYLLGRRGVNVPGTAELQWILQHPEEQKLKYILVHERSLDGIKPLDTVQYPVREVYHEAPFRLYAFNREDN